MHSTSVPCFRNVTPRGRFPVGQSDWGRSATGAKAYYAIWVP